MCCLSSAFYTHIIMKGQANVLSMRKFIAAMQATIPTSTSPRISQERKIEPLGTAYLRRR